MLDVYGEHRRNKDAICVTPGRIPIKYYMGNAFCGPPPPPQSVPHKILNLMIYYNRKCARIYTV